MYWLTEKVTVASTQTGIDEKTVMMRSRFSLANAKTYYTRRNGLTGLDATGLEPLVRGRAEIQDKEHALLLQAHVLGMAERSRYSGGMGTRMVTKPASRAMRSAALMRPRDKRSAMSLSLLVTRDVF